MSHSSLPIIAVVFVALASCGTEEPAPVCEHKPVGDKGIGTPCNATIDCEELTAVTCPVASDPADLPFCTLFCSADSDCGAGSTCVDRAAGIRYCVPEPCAAELARPATVTYDVKRPCDAGTVNPKGVGKPCASTDDCVLEIANLCPIAKDPNHLDFCTASCANDSDCGKDARCIPRPGPHGDNRFCVPVACFTEKKAGS